MRHSECGIVTRAEPATTSAERRATVVRDEIATLRRQLVDEDELTAALAQFDPVWEALSPHEQARVLNLLIDRIEFDGESGDTSITFHPTGIKSLAAELAQENVACRHPSRFRRRSASTVPARAARY